MAQGYLVQLGDGSLSTDDAIALAVIGFEIDQTLGGGSWTWSGTDAGTPVTDQTETGTYYLGTDGNVYFVPDTGTKDDVTTASATTTPTYADETFGTTGGDALLGDSGSEIIYGGATTSPTSTGADTIDGGAGDDVIYGGDGADSIEGGGDADVISGGDGNDVIYGDQSAPVTTSTETLEWLDAGRVNGTDLSAGFIHDSGGMQVSVSFTNDGGNTVIRAADILQYVGTTGLNPNSGLSLDGGAGPNVTASLSFDADAGSGLANEVENVVFIINDVDLAGWTDVITVNAYDEDGNPIAVTLTALGNDTVSGQTVTGDGGTNDGPSSINGAVLVEIAGPVHSIEIIYENGGTDPQSLWITDVQYDTMAPDDGNDVIDAGAGADTIFGGGGDDTVADGNGADTVFLGDGADTFTGTGSNAGDTDYIEGGAGNDTITVQQSYDTVYGGDGDDVITSTDELAQYGDQLHGDAGNDTITGANTHDTITGGSGNDVIAGDGGDDLITGGSGNDSIDGGADTDVIYGDYDAATLSGGLINGDFESGGGWVGTNSEYGPENAYLANGSTNRIAEMDGTAGTTTTLSQTFDVIDPGTATLSFDAVTRIGASLGTDGFTVEVLDSFGTVILTQTIIPESDTTWETYTLDVVFPTAGTYTVRFTEVGDNDSMGALLDNVQIEIAAGDDTIDGGEGNDTVFGGAGNDTVLAGEGNDSVFSGAGDDVIYGDATTIDYAANASDWTGAETPLTVTNSSDEAIEVYWIDGSGVLAASPSVIAPGDSLLIGTYESHNFVIRDLDGNDLQLISGSDTTVDYGAAGLNDTIDSGDGNDLVDGGAGNDNINASLGDDTVYGGSGDDTLDGGDGNDTIFGGAGNDTIAPGIGADVVDAGTGDDTVFLSSDDTLDGGADNDTLEATFSNFAENIIFTSATGGTADTSTFDNFEVFLSDGGADSYDATLATSDLTISTGADNDTVIGGSGNDIVFGGSGFDDLFGGAGNDTLYGDEGNDEFYGGAGDDIMSGGAGSDYFTTDAGADTILGGTGFDLYWVSDGFDGDVVDLGGDEIDATTYGYSEYLSLDGVTSDVDIIFTSGTGGTATSGAGDTLTFDNVDGFEGGGGVGGTFDARLADFDVSFFDYGGSTVVYGSEYNDQLDGEFGLTVDRYFDGGAGNDYLNTGAGNDTVLGGTGDDFIETNAGADTIYGGTGNDTITAGDDADTIFLEDGFGNDIIGGGEGGTDNDTLDASALTGDISLLLSATEAGTLTQGTNDATFSEIETVILGSGDDSVTGSAGNDTVATNLGADTVDMGAGDDTVDLGLLDSATDTVVLQNGDGDDVLFNFEAPVNNGDGTFTGGDQLDVSGLFDLGGQPVNTGDVLLLDSNGDGSGDAILTFPDGTSVMLVGVSASTLSSPLALEAMGIPLDLNYTVEGTSGDDIIDDTYIDDPDGDQIDRGDAADGSNDDVVLAGDGNDEIYAGDGNDVVYGGEGNDFIDGGNGFDTLFGDAGDDIIDFGFDNGGIAYGGDGNDEIVSYDAGGVEIHGDDGDDFVLAGVDADTIFGGTGNDDISAYGGADTIYGGAGNDLLDGMGGADFIYGDAGDDRIFGGGDNDLIVVNETTGTDTIGGGETGDDNDTLDFSTTADAGGVSIQFTGDEAGDYVIGSGAADGTFAEIENYDLTDFGDTVDASNDSFGVTIDGRGGDDDITGGSGDDTITGGAGNDILSGGSGNDTLVGGDGDDYLVGGVSMSGGDGNDTIDVSGPDATVTGDDGDDVIRFLDNPGTTTVTGGETGETTGDTLDLSGATNNLVVDLSGADPESGTVADGSEVLTFSEIETIVLGGGRDTIVLADGSGADVVRAFDMTDSGDGTTNDQLDVSGLTDAGGAIVNTDDVTVTDDGSGNAVLTFPGTESITLIGVAPAQLATSAQLASIGIPEPNYIVSGTVGDDVIDGAYLGDPEGDVVDGNDHSDGSNDDSIDAGAGNDIVLSGLGNDTVEGGSGADTLDGGDGDDWIGGGNDSDLITGGSGNDTVIADNGADTVYGGEGDDILIGGYDAQNATGGGPYPHSGDGDASGAAGADQLFGGAGNDTITGDAGDDLLNGGGDNDLLFGGSGNDSVIGEAGDDTLFGDAGDDFLNGVDGNDVLYGGDGNDAIEAGIGDDVIFGGANDDSVNGDQGNDTVFGGDGNDYVRGSFGNDTVYGGEGDDYVWGGYGDDLHVVEDSFGNDTYFGDSEQETLGDTLDFSAVTSDLTIDLTDGNNENGSFTDGTSTATFTEIENIVLGAGVDTLVLSDTSGTDAVSGFEAPIDNRDGTFTGGDQLDVSALTSDGSTPVHTGDVLVSDDGNGNAVLIFPSGSAITLIGVNPADVTDPAALEAMGIPPDPRDGTVSGTAGGDVINAGYSGDPEGDRVDNNDALLPGDSGNDDLIEAGAGDDFIIAGDGNDEIFGGADSDTIIQTDTDGVDVIYGGETGTDGDRIDFNPSADPGGVTVTFNGDEQGTYTVGSGGASGEFYEIEEIAASGFDDTIDASADTAGITVDGLAGNDTITGGDGNDALFGWDDDDLIYGGLGDDMVDGDAGNDVLDGASGNDVVVGDGGNDTLTGGTGLDQIYGGTGDDTLFVAEGDLAEGSSGDDLFVLQDLGEAGNISITVDGGSGDETGGDTLQLGTLADLSTLSATDDGTGSFSGSVTLDDGTILNFSEIENIICFTPGTHIATPRGARPIEELEVGDMVVTRDHGLQPIRWIGQRTVPGRGKLAPIRLQPGVLTGLERDLVVSPQHRLMFNGYRAELLFGEREVLVPARHLVDGIHARIEEVEAVTYIHMLFDDHEIVYAEGAATESFHPGEVGLSAITEASREEIFTIFPELRALPSSFGPTARRSLKRHEARLVL